MTDFSKLLAADRGQHAHAIHIVDEGGYEAWLKTQSELVRSALESQNFIPSAFEYAILTGDKAYDWSVLAVVADSSSLSSWCLAKLPEVLPSGTYRIAGGDPGAAMFGWLTAQYIFDRYISEVPKKRKGERILLTGEPARIEDMVQQAEATCMVRDLVNTPGADMGPNRLEEAASDLAEKFGAKLTVTRGDALETQYPMIYGVGKAAMRAHAPRLIELMWGKAEHPKIAIVGKGVTFDSGGLSIKSNAGMLLMKKDMGGAAHAMALSRLIMESGLPVRLHMLVPAVENSVDGNALRPGDILASRKGLTVEVTNTDAEGRLVLGDALTRAGEEEPELIIDFATLTGAARVALGPDLPAMFATSDELAKQLSDEGDAADDPVWHMPLWKGYDNFLASDIADCVNSAPGGFGGAVTAALFLQKFVPENMQWAHFDTFAWRPAAKPGRPKGGDALGLRASYAYLRTRYGA